MSFILCGALLISSCGSTKNVPYFQDISLTDQSVLANTAVFKEPIIQPDDIMSISIFTIDPTTSMVVNQVGSQAINSNAVQSALSATQPTAGFLVDKNGEIELALVGKRVDLEAHFVGPAGTRQDNRLASDGRLGDREILELRRHAGVAQVGQDGE